MPDCRNRCRMCPAPIVFNTLGSPGVWPVPGTGLHQPVLPPGPRVGHEPQLCGRRWRRIRENDIEPLFCFHLPQDLLLLHAELTVPFIFSYFSFFSSLSPCSSALKPVSSDSSVDQRKTEVTFTLSLYFKRLTVKVIANKRSTDLKTSHAYH